MKQKVAFSMIMGVITTCIISFILVSVNIGFRPDFVSIWLRSWGLAYVVAIPCILLIAPRVQAMVDNLFKGRI